MSEEVMETEEVQEPTEIQAQPVEERPLPVPMIGMGGILNLDKMKASIAERAAAGAVSEMQSWMVAQTAGRDLDRIKDIIKERAKIPQFYEKARYAKPIGKGQFAEGPSVWLLKQLAAIVGHLDISTVVHSAVGGETQFTVQVIDRVSNNKRYFTLTVPHTQWRSSDAPEHKADGGYVEHLKNPDKIHMKVMSAASKVERNVLQASIDLELVRLAEEECLKYSRIADTKLLGDKKTAIKIFTDQFNVNTGQLFNFLKIRDDKEFKPEHVRRLRGLWQAIKDGEINPAEVWQGAVDVPTGRQKALKAAKAAQQAEDSSADENDEQGATEPLAEQKAVEVNKQPAEVNKTTPPVNAEADPVNKQPPVVNTQEEKKNEAEQTAGQRTLEFKTPPAGRSRSHI